MSIAKHVNLPDTCPPLLNDLIQRMGSKKGAMTALGISDGILYRVISGAQEMPKTWEALIRSKLNLGVGALVLNGAVTPKQPAAPEFVLWDKKNFGELTLYRGGRENSSSKRTLKKVPQPIVDLVNKYGDVSKAARAAGHSGGWLMQYVNGGKPFVERVQRKIHAAMHGLGPISDTGAQDEPDGYELDMAIVLTKTQHYDRVKDYAEVLRARLVFRMNTGSGWLLIYHMAKPDLAAFKRLAAKEAQKVVCP